MIKESAKPAYSKSRKFERFPVDARIAVLRKGERHLVLGRILGISEAGLSALLAVELELGQTVCLEFRLPSSEKPLALRGIVRNRSGARYGFEFLTLSGKQREAIWSFCRSHPASRKTFKPRPPPLAHLDGTMSAYPANPTYSWMLGNGTW